MRNGEFVNLGKSRLNGGANARSRDDISPAWALVRSSHVPLD